MGCKMITPSTTFNFASATLDSRITFARAGATATRVNAGGLVQLVGADTPRFDFDPVTLVCKGLLIEEQRKNLQPQGSNMALWTGSAVTLTGSQTAPNNSSEAVLVSESATTAPHYFYYTGVSVTSGQNYANTVYVKNQTNTQWIQIALSSSTFGTNAWANFNVVNGVVGNKGSAVVTHSISDAGNGWWRCNIVAPASATATGAAIQIAFTNNTDTTSRLLSYLGTGKQFLAWGAQTEQGAFPTSYIPTDGTAGGVTRNADVATITGTNFSDFWQASKGGAQVLAIPSTVSGIRPLVQYDDGTANEIIALRGNTTNPELYIVDGGTPQAQLDAGTIAANTAYSLTGWWQTNDCKARLDSGAVVTDDTATIPTVTQARLGSDGTNYLNGHLATVNYYDTFSGQIYTRRKNKVIFNLM